MRNSFHLSNIYNKYSVLVNYCLIGFCGVGLDFVIFIVLTQKIGLFYQYANFISVSCGIINNFFLNAFLNFKKTNHLFLRMVSFYMVGMVGWLISSLLLYLLIERLRFSIVFSKLIIIFVVTAVQFSLNRLITFRSKQYEAL
jgi:putative flippase GtrA